ncbi:MAG: hypothetical protein EOP06_12000, partial [Proteobacteria bacterium]
MRLAFLAVIALFFCQGWSQSKASDSLSYYETSGDYFKGIRYAERISPKLVKSGNFKRFAEVSIAQSKLHWLLSDSQSAIPHLFNSLKIAEKNRAGVAQVMLLQQIGRMYEKIYDLTAAQKYVRLSMKKAYEVRHDSLIGSVSQSMYGIYSEIQNDSAWYYLKRSNSFLRKDGSMESLFTIQNNLFAFYAKQSNWPTAKIHIDSAMYFLKKHVSRKSQRSGHMNLAVYYITAENNYKKAEDAYQHVIATITDTLSSEVCDLYWTYADILKHNGKFNEAFRYMDKATIIRDYIYDKKLSSNIRTLEMKYN